MLNYCNINETKGHAVWVFLHPDGIKTINIDKSHPKWAEYLALHEAGDYEAMFKTSATLDFVCDVLGGGKTETEHGIEVYQDKNEGLAIYLNKITGEITCSYQGFKQLLGDAITEHIMKLNDAKDTIKTKAFVRFIARVMRNPSPVSVEELFLFIANNGLTITPDGHCIFIKAVHPDRFDIYSRTVEYKDGAVVSMPRRLVEHNRNQHCAQGLHVGTLAYVRGYAHKDSTIIAVLVDPADVVSVPNDQWEKCRVWRLKVLGEASTLFSLEDMPVFYGVNNHIDDDDEWNYDSDDDYYDYYHDDMIHDDDDDREWNVAEEVESDWTAAEEVDDRVGKYANLADLLQSLRLSFGYDDDDDDDDDDDIPF